MTKQIRLNAFDMNCVAHQSPGLWTHPRDRSTDYTELSVLDRSARTLERGRFDGLFLADVLGVYDVYGGSPDAALRNATQVPVERSDAADPGDGAVTEHLGFGVTCNLSYRAALSVRAAHVDARPSDRAAASAGTSSPAISTARRAATGKDKPDRARRPLRRRRRIHGGGLQAVGRQLGRRRGAARPRARHLRRPGQGPCGHASRASNYRVDAIHLSEPSPQRTPVLYQAGASPRGRQFAAAHAECVFMSGPSAKVIAPRVAAIRDAAAKAGRNPADILIFSMFTIILGRTEAEAQAKFADYRKHISAEGALTLMSGWTGVDFSTYALDQQVRHVENDAGRSAMDNITRADPDRVWTVREVAEHVGIGGIGPVAVGSPEKVADDIEAWVEETDVDGFNLAFAVTPGDFEDVVDLLVPELPRRGRYKRAYEPGTLREKLFGAGRARLAAPHPAARYRAGGGESSGVGPPSFRE